MLRQHVSQADSQRARVFRELLQGYDPRLAVWRAEQSQPVRGTPPGLAVDGSPLVQRCVLLCPRTDCGWGAESFSGVLRTLDEVLAAVPSADPQRVVVTGISMGGAGAWALGAHAPQRFIGVAPVCGFAGSLSTKQAITRALSRTQIWAVHGHNDVVIPVSETRDMAARLASAPGGAKMTYREVEGRAPHGYESMAGHDCWTAAYADVSFWEWVRGLPPALQ